jgi:hypothetical protein
MGLILCATKGLGADHLSVFDGERKIGRIYKTDQGDWFWGVDWFEAGQKLLTDYAPTPEEAMAKLTRAWEHKQSRDRFEAAWQGESGHAI